MKTPSLAPSATPAVVASRPDATIGAGCGIDSIGLEASAAKDDWKEAIAIISAAAAEVGGGCRRGGSTLIIGPTFNGGGALIMEETFMAGLMPIADIDDVDRASPELIGEETELAGET